MDHYVTADSFKRGEALKGWKSGRQLYNAPATALSKVLDGRLEMQVMYADNGQDMVKEKEAAG